MEVGNQQGRHHDVTPIEVSPNFYPCKTRPLDNVSVVVWDMSTGTGVSISLEVGNQQGRHNDVSPVEVSPDVYP